MKFERKHYIYILLALVLSLTAIAQEQTISSELANFTEINTSRIFRVYDASTSEILLSSDAIYLNHVNGGINEVKITSTDTQFMNDIDMAGNDINNCGNCGGSDNLSWQNSKVNKSGDTMTAALLINPDNINITDDTQIVTSTWGTASVKSDQNSISGCETLTNSTVFTCFFGAYKTGWNATTQKKAPLPANSQMFNFYGKGWDGSSWGSSMGNIVISTGSTAWNTTNKPTEILFQTSRGTTKYNSIKIDENSNITVLGQKTSGTGYDYVCVERSTGKQINSAVACDLI